MSNFYDTPFGVGHNHAFLGANHSKNERKVWAVIVLCSVMMIAEIGGGSLFGSLALVADGLHMSTHAGAMLIAALTYTYARNHANDPRFVFGTGKMGDLAGFSSAIILAMIALLIVYEAITRFLSPIPIHFEQAIPIAVVGLLVNIASAWLLSGEDHQGHSHGHHHGHNHEEVQQISVPSGTFDLSIFEDGVPPVFRITPQTCNSALSAQDVTITTIRPDGSHQVFIFIDKSNYLESTSEIPEPHAFKAFISLPDGDHSVEFKEHDHAGNHGVDGRDHNMRAAYIHVMTDAAVSVLAIVGLLLAKTFGWLWMDPLAGIVGALVIANWSFGLIRDTGRNLMDVNPDGDMASKVRGTIEANGGRLLDLHVWRLGPGHLGVVASVATDSLQRGPQFYHSLLQHIKGLSHVTIEVHSPQSP